jgi:hypothetical protein
MKNSQTAPLTRKRLTSKQAGQPQKVFEKKWLYSAFIEPFA